MPLSWQPTSLPAAGSRTDDVWFNDKNVGWAVNSDGKVYHTTDGAETWVEQRLFADSYLRCLSFSSNQKGWIGTLSGPHSLYRTDDGGASWNPVSDLPDGGPARICGLVAVNDDVIFAAGTNYPDEPAGVICSRDGGTTWDLLDLGLDPALLVDIYFEDENTGWVVGGLDEVRHPARDTVRRDVIPVVLSTIDGGQSWTNAIGLPIALGAFPRGEWGWKIQRLGAQTILVSLENLHDGAILRSDDLGATWERLPINDRQRNANLEGIGFLDKDHGWVGGWGDLFFQGGFTSETSDGGRTWDDANHVGFRLNRFRFIGDPVEVGYASGDTVYKLSDAPAPSVATLRQAVEEPAGDQSISLEIDVPEETQSLVVLVWERFGREVRRLVSEAHPQPGRRQISWDLTDAEGVVVPAGSFIVRVVTDESSTSRVIHRRILPSQIKQESQP
ncbi:Ycf48-like protein [Roseobacter fucihabitans]|uniref:Ycf48-like protein n=1 Tax=Roseobacter fucihabitans TaxID=1537242 RepID=A0ABZ2BW49_9RHOB|nr:YCF48-related protein [Roseobacter litoralis]MBC6966769.1 Ycf48-like protein [Roseobacter litoralis]